MRIITGDSQMLYMSSPNKSLIDNATKGLSINLQVNVTFRFNLI